MEDLTETLNSMFDDAAASGDAAEFEAIEILLTRMKHACACRASAMNARLKGNIAFALRMEENAEGLMVAP